MENNEQAEEQIPTIPKMDELKSLFFHNFTNKEISMIISMVNKIFTTKQERRKLVFARTTETSLKMTVDEWIEDTAEDHLYLLENPPSQEQKSEQANISPPSL